jgi:hypothetical protein
MKLREIIKENKKTEVPAPRNFVAKNAIKTTSGAGAHKDKKRAEKQGDAKHKKDRIPMDERVRDPEDWDEGNTEPPNNFAVYINGKKWKVFKGRGQFAGDYKEIQHHRQLQNWAQAKSAATGKKWEVYITGENATESVQEDATPGATSAASIATVVNPHIAIGSARGKKSYTGSSGKSGTKAPKPPKARMQKPTDNALDMVGTSIFGGKTIKR